MANQGFGALQELCEEFNNKEISKTLTTTYKEVWDKNNTPLISKKELLEEVVCKLYNCKKRNNESKKSENTGVGFGPLQQLCAEFGQNEKMKDKFSHAVQNIMISKGIAEITTVEILMQTIRDFMQTQRDNVRKEEQVEERD